MFFFSNNSWKKHCLLVLNFTKQDMTISKLSISNLKIRLWSLFVPALNGNSLNRQQALFSCLINRISRNLSQQHRHSLFNSVFCNRLYIFNDVKVTKPCNDNILMFTTLIAGDITKASITENFAINDNYKVVIL